MKVFTCALLFIVIQLHCVCTQLISNMKCIEYATLFDNEKETRQIDLGFFADFFNIPKPGKVAAEPGEFPHMAHLGYGDGVKTDKVFVCGGVLISEQYILTSASCTNADVVFLHNRKRRQAKQNEEEEQDDDNDEEEDEEEVGVIDILEKEILGFPRNTSVRWVTLGNNITGIEEYMVEEIIIHPESNPPLNNDIALIKLREKVNFSKYIMPACLYTQTQDLSNVSVVATGWGALAFNKELSSELMKVSLEILEEDECDTTLVTMNRNTTICAGDRVGSDTLCQGDGGAPLQIRNKLFPKIYDVVGIVTWGYMCNIMNFPLYAAKVSTFIPWIENIVWAQDK